MNTEEKLRAICLKLPDAVQKHMMDNPAYRVRNKIFALSHRWKDIPTVWCKAPPGSQAILVEAAPERFFVPPYVGHKGWIGIWLNGRPDWQEIEALIRRSYRLIAPRKLAALVVE